MPPHAAPRVGAGSGKYLGQPTLPPLPAFLSAIYTGFGLIVCAVAHDPGLPRGSAAPEGSDYRLEDMPTSHPRAARRADGRTYYLW